MQKIRCVVERITYQNPENGYSVLILMDALYEDDPAIRIYAGNVCSSVGNHKNATGLKWTMMNTTRSIGDSLYN